MQEKNLTFSMKKANLYGSLMGFIPAMFLATIYWVIHGHNFIEVSSWEVEFFHQLNILPLFMIIAVFILLIFLHEFLHCLGCLVKSEASLKDTKIKFNLKTLTPYFHCSKKISLKVYRLAVILPTLVLGVLPCIIGIAFGINILMFFSIFMIATAGGDFLILWLLRNEDKDSKVLDHPTECGCILYL